MSEVPRILRMPQVRERTGLSRSTVYRLLEQGRFPTPISLSQNAVGWPEPVIDAWLRERIAAGWDRGAFGTVHQAREVRRAKREAAK